MDDFIKLSKKNDVNECECTFILIYSAVQVLFEAI